MSCFIGNEHIGNWTNKHLTAVRYLPNGGVNGSASRTIEAIVTDATSVHFIRHEDIYYLTDFMTTDGLLAAEFVTHNEHQLALAFSYELPQHTVMVIYLCNRPPQVAGCNAYDIFLAVDIDWPIRLGFSVYNEGDDAKFMVIGNVSLFWCYRQCL